ncbi:sulfur carrier protein ThiS [Pantoea sp. Mhis]|uniref:sulfur carrier protein ThiS n=1 Tax=Pantoea sp. Mhis TaxID=2576759 RepID=UPI00135CAC4B|nr:sulfur carrier protein ThiS [Pantoea sp. Mhis]MXP56781.1 sulfur carrier protein ThiS [Pantoea sp. Mhis]
MKITLNGKPISTQSNNITELLKEFEFDTTYVATAFNGNFISKNNYNIIMLEEGCQIEVLTPMQGG